MEPIEFDGWKIYVTPAGFVTATKDDVVTYIEPGVKVLYGHDAIPLMLFALLSK